MSEYRVQLLAVEAKLAKDPTNPQLLELKSDLEEMIELSGEVDNNDQLNNEGASKMDASSSRSQDSQSGISSSSSANNDSKQNNLVTNSNNQVKSKGPISEEEKLFNRRKEKNKKKRAKLREKIKEQLDIAESEKQSWQSFANKKGLKGLNKKSIFASPHSLTGKVGVGTNGIADAPSTVAGTKNQQATGGGGGTRRKY